MKEWRTQSDNSGAVRQAFSDGHLLVHMLEVNAKKASRFMEGDNFNLRSVVEVMNGNPNAEYHSSYHHVQGHPEGFVGLPCTALHKDYPVQLYENCDGVGMLFDAHDKQFVKPIMVGSSDLYSGTVNGRLEYAPNCMFDELAKSQHIRAEIASSSNQFKGIKNRFNIATDLETMERRASDALPKLWKGVADLGWRKYTKQQLNYPGMNEVSVVAHLQGLRGFVVNGNKFSGLAPHIAQKSFEGYVESVRGIRDWLTEHYPERFPEKLPVYLYNSHRRQESLVELTEEQIQQPVLSEVDVQARLGARGNRGSGWRAR